MLRFKLLTCTGVVDTDTVVALTEDVEIATALGFIFRGS